MLLVFLPFQSKKEKKKKKKKQFDGPYITTILWCGGCYVNTEHIITKMENRAQI